MNGTHGAESTPLNGVLVLDKPQGISSTAALSIAKRLLRERKAGHTGSLDPLANGVLPLCFGKATKLCQFLLEADKKYQASFVFGISTASGDAEGECTGGADASALCRAEVQQALQAFRGTIKQVPPMFSALKKDGQPLYKLARRGLEVERAPRTVHIHALELLDFLPGKQARAELVIHCSKGTYIRSLAQDLGEMLGCGGHVARLRRSRSGPFGEEDGVSLERLREYCARSLAEGRALLQPAENIVRHLPEVRVAQEQGRQLRQGADVAAPPAAPNTGLVRIKEECGLFIGVGEILAGKRLQPRRVLASAPEIEELEHGKKSWH